MSNQKPPSLHYIKGDSLKDDPNYEIRDIRDYKNIRNVTKANQVRFRVVINKAIEQKPSKSEEDEHYE